MIAVADDRFPPVGIVKSEIFLFALFIIFIGKPDFHMDKKPQFICRPDKVLRGHCAVEPDKVESVLFRLADVITVAFIIAFSGKIRMIVGHDPPDISAETICLAVDQNGFIAHSRQFIETENFRLQTVSFERIKNRISGSPEFQSRSIKRMADNTGRKPFLTQQCRSNDLTAGSGDGTVFNNFGPVAKKQTGSNGAVDINIAHNKFPYLYKKK